MAYQKIETVSLTAGADLRTPGLYSLLTIENDGGVAKVIAATAPTQTPIGILAEQPDAGLSTDGLVVPVAMLKGIVPMRAGGTITAGNLIVAHTVAGRVVGVANVAALAADTIAVGVAMTSAVDGDVFDVFAQIMTSATET
jgi:hypothetical protein